MKRFLEYFKSGGRQPNEQSLEAFFAPLISKNKADDMTLEALFKQDEKGDGFTFSSEIVKMNEEQHLVY